MNNTKRRNNIYTHLATILLVFAGLLMVENIWADGSRDLYPSGATGYRAYLASNNNAIPGSLPYGSRGTHYVYAKVGEKIALASSEWTQNSALKLFDPDNVDVSPSRGSAGRIVNRNQELAGPKLSTSDNTSNRYTPVYYTVQKEGIHRVEFWPNTNVTSSFQNTGRYGPAENWTDFTGQSSYIAAWDVSVINSAGTYFIPGRVYANMLNMGISAATTIAGGFYGKMYVLTKDGYTYRVDNNGNNGIVFSFFVNNNGFVKGLQSNGSVDYTPLYKSLPNIDNAISNKQIWNPTEPDNEQNITHKMFYTLPSEDLPKNTLVNGAVPGGSTWLKNNVIEPRVMDVKIEGSDGTGGQASTKGGFIKFNTESQGSYTVKIESEDTPAFPTRYLYGTAVAGENSVFWDGRDGNNVPVPSGMTPAKITVQLQGAEVHFPYFDMEHNINGIKLELLDHESLPGQEIAVSDIVFWNDVDIPNVIGGNNGVNANPKNNSHLPVSLGGTGSSGLSSAVNGHKWGGGSNITGTFGDVRAMDTWTFIKGEEESIQTEVVIKRADLKITELSVDNGTVKIDEEITYTVKVKNGESDDGGCPIESAPFSFILPPGFVPTEEFTPIFSGNSCGSESVALVYNEVAKTYFSSLDLPNGCEITYTFKVKVTDQSDPANTKAIATIMRPNDVTDPDATNTSSPDNPIAPDGIVDLDAYYYLPINPFFEVEYNGEGGVSNNIKSVETIISDEPLNTTNAVDDFYETGKNTQVSGNVLDNDMDIESDIQTVTTTGTYDTENGGSVIINSNGIFTYTPPIGGFSGFDSFNYTICDNGTPQACDNAEVVIAVGICYEAVEGKSFKWSNTDLNGAFVEDNTLSKTITQPAANYGFVFDIYELDNSFNMKINGVMLAENEIEFQSSGTPAPGINIMFADGDKYETNTQDIWQMRGDEENPLVRVMIGPTGKVSMYGSKTSGGVLHPLVLFNGNNFNVVPMHVGSGEDNEIAVTQNMVGVTKIEGMGYGANQIDCPNYWYGYNGSNEWADIENWTDNYVPENLQDIEFATEDNNSGTILGLSGKAAGLGVAKQDLHLDDAGRVIKDLINKSPKSLIVTLDNLLVVDGKVHEDNTGGIIVQADPDDTKAMGSLIFNNPANNQIVAATVQFHNNACECADCGFYRKQWQYFGVPVKRAEFPHSDVDGDETINMYVESFNGDKWRAVSGALDAFKGYQINNSLNAAPNKVYNFAGTLFVGDATVALTKTAAVNYSGTNLVSNSYTAAIPINVGAMTFPSDVEQTVYLFNTGTRDQWRKLNGTSIPGYKSGQYLAVPIELGGQNDFPDRIPSTHAFMLLANDAFVSGNLQINYSELTKNSKVKLGDGTTEIITRSANRSDNASVPEATNTTQQLPSLTIDVIGEESADRLWIFQKEGTSHDFNNGWDGRKMLEGDMSQLYINAKDDSKLQVATVPELNDVTLGFVAEVDGKYTLDFSSSGTLKGVDVYLHDAVTGMTQLVGEGHSYLFEAKKGESATRFNLTYKDNNLFLSNDEALLEVSVTDEGNIFIVNASNKSCSVFISDNNGTFLQRLEVEALSEEVMDNFGNGTYMVRLQNSDVNDVRRIVIN